MLRARSQPGITATGYSALEAKNSGMVMAWPIPMSRSLLRATPAITIDTVAKKAAPSSTAATVPSRSSGFQVSATPSAADSASTTTTCESARTPAANALPVINAERSCRSFWSSTRHSAITRLARVRQIGGLDGSASGEPAGRAAGATDVTDVAPFLQALAGVATEHVLEGRVRPQLGLQLVRGADRAEPAAVHERDPLTQVVGLVQVVGGQQDGHAGGGAQLLEALPHPRWDAGGLARPLIAFQCLQAQVARSSTSRILCSAGSAPSKDARSLALSSSIAVPRACSRWSRQSAIRRLASAVSSSRAARPSAGSRRRARNPAATSWLTRVLTVLAATPSCWAASPTPMPGWSRTTRSRSACEVGSGYPGTSCRPARRSALRSGPITASSRVESSRVLRSPCMVVIGAQDTSVTEISATDLRPDLCLPGSARAHLALGGGEC